MAKKLQKTQIFRHLTQLVFFFLLPGLYILAFGGLKSIYQILIKGNFNFLEAFPSLIEFTTIIFLTILFGRFFCGWICTFGAYNDLIHIISKKVFKINFKVNEEVDSVLKYVKYIILLLIVIFIWTMGSKAFQSASPWDAFAQITDFPNVLSNFTLGVILLMLITIGTMFIERFFCRYLCPLGAVFTILSKISIFKIKKPNVKCGKCRACTNNCSMGLPLYKVNEVRGGECINCLKCVDVCPRNNAQANIVGEDINPGLAASIAIATFAGVYGINNLGGSLLVQNGITSQTNETSMSSTSSTNSTSQTYQDGTYTGTGTGFRGATTKISVTIKNGKVAKIVTISNGDTPDFYQRVSKVIPNKIISSQSTDVDTVSGATFSSRGIMTAVEDALSQAK